MGVKDMAPERLFEPFLDPVDMVGCFPATATLQEINEAAAAHGLRFPLVLDGSQTLAAHLSAMEFTPASARFGPYVDNVLGMNWQLPGGALARVGERVAKTSTGYDLQRFLLHSEERFGHATAHVLRLRPIGGAVAAGCFAGPDEALESVARQLRISPWNHWIDRLDYVHAAGNPSRIEVVADCLPGEEAVFHEYFGTVADAGGAAYGAPAAPGLRSLPSLCVKTGFAQCCRLAQLLSGQAGGEVRVLVLNGYLLLNPAEGLSSSLVRDLEAEVVGSGGHVFGLSRQPREPGEPERTWLENLEAEWRRL